MPTGRHGVGPSPPPPTRLNGISRAESHQIYEVTPDGTARRILGTAKRGLVDGDPARAQLTYPNGIACDPWAPRLYINEYVNESPEGRPRRVIVREIQLPD